MKHAKTQLNLVDIRNTYGLNQSEFWGRIGVTQSGGSRYENGRTMPRPTAILFDLVYVKTYTMACAELQALRS